MFLFLFFNRNARCSWQHWSDSTHLINSKHFRVKLKLDRRIESKKKKKNKKKTKMKLSRKLHLGCMKRHKRIPVFSLNNMITLLIENERKIKRNEKIPNTCLIEWNDRFLFSNFFFVLFQMCGIASRVFLHFFFFTGYIFRSTRYFNRFFSITSVVGISDILFLCTTSLSVPVCVQSAFFPVGVAVHFIWQQNEWRSVNEQKKKFCENILWGNSSKLFFI